MINLQKKKFIPQKFGHDLYKEPGINDMWYLLKAKGKKEKAMTTSQEFTT